MYWISTIRSVQLDFNGMIAVQNVMAKDSPLGIFLFVSEWVVTGLLPAFFNKKKALFFISP